MGYTLTEFAVVYDAVKSDEIEKFKKERKNKKDERENDLHSSGIQ